MYFKPETDMLSCRVDEQTAPSLTLPAWKLHSGFNSYRVLVMLLRHNLSALMLILHSVSDSHYSRIMHLKMEWCSNPETKGGG